MTKTLLAFAVIFAILATPMTQASDFASTDPPWPAPSPTFPPTPDEQDSHDTRTAFLDEIFNPGRAVMCATECAARAGSGACYARCLADGRPCDNGVCSR